MAQKSINVIVWINIIAWVVPLHQESESRPASIFLKQYFSMYKTH